MEEDGRLGNLLIETATLYLIGRQANVTVSLLPQVDLTLCLIYSGVGCLRNCPGGEEIIKAALPSPSACHRPQGALHLRQVH